VDDLGSLVHEPGRVMFERRHGQSITIRPSGPNGKSAFQHTSQG
jgi:hypothetical protein